MVGFPVIRFLQAVHFPEGFDVFILDHAVVIIGSQFHLRHLFPEAQGYEPGDIKMQLFMRQSIIILYRGSHPGGTFDMKDLQGEVDVEGIFLSDTAALVGKAAVGYRSAFRPGGGSSLEIRPL